VGQIRGANSPQPAAGHRHFALDSGQRAVSSSENGLKNNDSKCFTENWFRVSKKEFRSPAGNLARSRLSAGSWQRSNFQ
jgi:hypothetical protein